MQKFLIKATYDTRLNAKKRVNANINKELFCWFEDGVHFVFAPAFDLVGTGYTEEEAKESFNLVLSEYFSYSIKNRTFIMDLKNLGWNISLNKDSFIAPNINEFIDETELKEFELKQGFKKESAQVEFA